MMTLESVTSSAEVVPPRIVIYGVPGVGKTTFGCTFAGPILLRTEDGAAALDVPTFPLARTYRDVIEMIGALRGEHPYKTVVIDSLDWLEALVFAQTCARLRVGSIERLDYGKGYVEADAEWAALMGGLDVLRLRKGMTVVLIAHSEIRPFLPPDAPACDRYQPKLHRRSWSRWQEWADMVLFCNYHSGTAKVGSAERVDDTDNRIVYTEDRPSWTAKNRCSLPPAISIGTDRTWRPFHMALEQAGCGLYVLPGMEKRA